MESVQPHEEMQYINLIRKINDKGTFTEGRNGWTKNIFGEMMRFSLQGGKIPILTTKKTAWKTCLKELLWFIRGETDNKLLQEQNVHIWDANASHEFMESRGLDHYPEGKLGPIYGFQWRGFNADYDMTTGRQVIKTNNTIEGALPTTASAIADVAPLPATASAIADQLQQIIDALKDPKQRSSRRLIMTAWNPCQLDEMALPPCHVMCQFNVHDGNKLSCALTQRSVDASLGLPFNIASYSFLTHILAEHCGLEAYEFVHFMGNCHIYADHIEPMKAIFDRTPYEFPTVEIADKKEDINDYEVEDFIVSNYKCHDAIKMTMVA